MKNEYTIYKRKFENYILEGSHYEIGKMQGKIMKKNKEAIKLYTSGNFKPEKSRFTTFEEVYDFYDKHCPGLSEEAQGFSEVLDVNINQLFFYDFPISIQKNCSQFVALPKITENKQVLVGRSYEWNFNDEDLQLRITKVDKKYKHIGFSGMCYGRYEGLNDQGLCVTVSSGGAWDAPQKNKSLNWALAVRVLLDNCKNVDEATKTLQKIPVEGTNIFILSDINGNASYLECFDTQYEIKQYDQISKNHYIIGTNHYNLPSKIKYNEFNNPWLLPNSKQRYEIIETLLKKSIPNIKEKTILNILAKEMPEGICCHWQTDFFGTLWQVVFNVSKGKAIISFGPSTHNKWFEFTLEDSIETHEYEAVFLDKRIES